MDRGEKIEYSDDIDEYLYEDGRTNDLYYARKAFVYGTAKKMFDELNSSFMDDNKHRSFYRESKKIKVGDVLVETSRNLTLKYIGLNEDGSRARFIGKSNKTYSMPKQQFIEGVKKGEILKK